MKNLKITKTPLAISLCQNCKFVQLSHNFNNTYLYNKEYGYESVSIVQWKNHLSGITKEILKIKNLNKNSVVMT